MSELSRARLARYDSELAAVESAGADVPPAELPDVGEDTLCAIDGRVRYLAGRIADEGPRGDI